MPTIYDNLENPLVKGLNTNLQLSQRADFCVGYFNLRGWATVADSVEALAGATVMEEGVAVHRVCRLLVGMQKMPAELLQEHFSANGTPAIDNSKTLQLRRQLAQEFRTQLTIGAPTANDAHTLKALRRQLESGKITVKLHCKYPLHAKLYVAHSADTRIPIVGFLGSSNLTLAGLVRQGELNIDVLEQDAARKLAAWFDDRWNDRFSIDITAELIEVLHESWLTERLPYYIYLKMAYHLSQEARAGINQYRLPKRFQTELLEFQQRAVQVAAHHLHKRGGVIIGDVVGLGKTITATALAKMMEDELYLETLIICPANLREMWEGYAHEYQLRAKVISQAEAPSKLPTMRCYRIVIIDESHNLRNREGKRYRHIRDYLERYESKVILLSATPYNKSYLDLSNQLRLFLPEDRDIGISPENYIQSIGGGLQFNAKHNAHIRSIAAFEHSPYADDWRELMRLYLVRRTRSFIKNNYAKTDPNNQRKFLVFSDGSQSYFPDRIPKKVEYAFTPDDPHDQYAKLYAEEVVNTLKELNLPRYGLGNFVHKKPAVKPTAAEKRIIENLSRAGKRLMGFCRTNLFKRLESSGYSFLLSISRHILRNYLFIYAIEQGLPLPIGKNIVANLDDYLEDEDTDGDGDDNTLSLILREELYIARAEKLYGVFQTVHQHTFDWISCDLLATETLRKSLLHDSRELLRILQLGKDWNPEQDQQLNALHTLLTHTHAEEKVLVFTQFADTAQYLTEQLQRRGVANLASVTGSDEYPTHKAQRFSPRSNKKPEIVAAKQELRVLIATDVLSEGQNLQDAHVVVNYDLPWAIIRLIQRAGRVDRIGQQAEKILCYSFLPEEGIERIIRLRSRLSQRIQENALVVGSDETFFDGDPINIADLYNEKAGILDGEEEDAEVDLASYAYQIWKNAIDANPELAKRIPEMPNVVFSTKTNTEDTWREGTILYARTDSDNDMLTWVDRQGNMITQSQYAILRAAQCALDTPAQPQLPEHFELVAKGLEHIQREERDSIGTLGRKNGTRNRVYKALERYQRENENTLFDTALLRAAIQAIYLYPLRESAQEILSRQLKVSIPDGDLANVVMSLHEEDKLVVVHDGSSATRHTHIICSLGLRNA